LAINSFTWPIGFQGVAPRNRITDGLAAFRMARIVPTRELNHGLLAAGLLRRTVKEHYRSEIS